MITIRAALRHLRLRLLPVPGQALGLVVLVAVLAAALVSAPLMVASAEQGAWEQERDRLSETVLGATLGTTTQARRQRTSDTRISRATELDEAVTEAARRARVDQDGLGLPETIGFLMDPILFTGPEGGGYAQLVFRTGSFEGLEIVAGQATDTGVLIPQRMAERSGLGPGDRLPVTPSMRPGGAELVVGGVYADLTTPLPETWQPHSFLFLPRLDERSGNLVHPPPAVLAPRDTAVATAAALEEHLFLEWFLPLDPGLPVAVARDAVGATQRMQAAIASPESAVSRLVDEEGYQTPVGRTALPTALETVDTTGTLLEPPVRAVGIGGGVAALVLVGAWAAQRMRRREDEQRSLVARGLSPARGAGQAAREAVLPVLLGLAAGGAIGWLLVQRLGPADTIPPGVLGRSLAVLAGGGIAAVAVVAVVTAVLVTRLDSIGSGQAAHVLARVPWLAITAVLAVVATVPLFTAEPAAEGGGIDVLTLVVPLLITVVVAGALTAALPRLATGPGGRLRRLPVGPFLAARRVLAGQGAARLVVVTTALSLGLVVYAGALGSSTDRTIATKAAVATGSDVVVPIGADTTGRELPPGAMVVGVEREATLLPGAARVNVLVVRPDAVAGVVRWDEGLADRPLDELMTALAGDGGQRVPVLVAGDVADGVVDGTDGELTLDFGYYSMPVQVVGRAEAFPGQSSSEPLVVAEWDAYLAAVEEAGRDPALVLAREVWSRGELVGVLDSLAATGYVPSAQDQPTTADAFTARPELTAQTWSLDYLRAVALAAGVLGLVGVTMHAVAQQRRRTVAGLLLRRMGMTDRAADVSAGLEIGLLAGLSALVAVVVALPASALVLRVLDPVPSLEPEAVFAVPWGSIAAVGAGVVLVTVIGSWLVGRTARRATGGQVMRDAT
ncbi:ABC transporter permease [Blastococcus saxobsidens]|uniref:Putative ABC transport system permease protein n=1 Tax=Blastococcus saxobsidens TaxID=138336 RepID=A0A4Q7YBF9_9ACTN|nr:ABC transporter permease [Blastococcus saxobsidens]RZU33924.1 putative ABC transport system permease protein [Blastococcus saxobsidens]